MDQIRIIPIFLLLTVQGHPVSSAEKYSITYLNNEIIYLETLGKIKLCSNLPPDNHFKYFLAPFPIALAPSTPYLCPVRQYCPHKRIKQPNSFPPIPPKFSFTYPPHLPHHRNSPFLSVPNLLPLPPISLKNIPQVFKFSNLLYLFSLRSPLYLFLSSPSLSKSHNFRPSNIHYQPLHPQISLYPRHYCHHTLLVLRQ
jgi:hypothetical protein